MTGKNIGGHSIGAPSNVEFVEIRPLPTGGCFPVARFQDRCSGHQCWPPRPNNEASTDTFINGRGAHRKTDTYPVHCCGDSCHSGFLSEGSSTVFVNGLELGRVTDPVSCGSMVAEGSPDTFCG